jgi:hypothetical protein
MKEPGNPSIDSALQGRRPGKRWPVWAVVVLGLYAVLTGGFCVFDRTDFGNEVRLDVENPPLSRIEVDPRESAIHVPLLFHYYGFEKPYRLTMYVYSKTKAFDQIELDEVKVALDSGEVVKGMHDWRRTIKEEDWYGGIASGGVFMTHQVLDVAVPRAVPFTITWKGRLRKKGGEVVPFAEEATHRVRSGVIVAPYWFVLSASMQG